MSKTTRYSNCHFESRLHTIKIGLLHADQSDHQPLEFNMSSTISRHFNVGLFFFSWSSGERIPNVGGAESSGTGLDARGGVVDTHSGIGCVASFQTSPFKGKELMSSKVYNMTLLELKFKFTALATAFEKCREKYKTFPCTLIRKIVMKCLS